MSTKLALAAVSYYGIDAGLPVRTDINTAEDGVLYLTLSIAIKDEDLGPIVKRMSAAQQKEEFEPVFTADISDDELRQDYNALQPALKSRFGSFGRYKAWRMENKQPAQEITDEQIDRNLSGFGFDKQTEGVGGRKVQHVDVPEQQGAVSELPASVWVFGLDMATGQHSMASDFRECPGGAEYLMQVGMLTPEQKLKYGVQS